MLFYPATSCQGCVCGVLLAALLPVDCLLAPVFSRSCPHSGCSLQKSTHCQADDSNNSAPAQQTTARVMCSNATALPHLRKNPPQPWHSRSRTPCSKDICQAATAQILSHRSGVNKSCMQRVESPPLQQQDCCWPSPLSAMLCRVAAFCGCIYNCVMGVMCAWHY